jgi:hypothetical protein
MAAERGGGGGRTRAADATGEGRGMDKEDVCGCEWEPMRGQGEGARRPTGMVGCAEATVVLRAAGFRFCFGSCVRVQDESHVPRRMMMMMMLQRLALTPCCCRPRRRQTVARALQRVTCHISHVTCHMSHVTCHMSHVTCHMSHVTCHQSKSRNRISFFV